MRKETPLEMSENRQFTPVVLFATLPYHSARVVFVYGKDSFFFRKYVCIQVFLWSIHAGIAQLGEWGLAPILDKLESFVVNAFWLVAGRFFE